MRLDHGVEYSPSRFPRVSGQAVCKGTSPIGEMDATDMHAAFEIPLGVVNPRV
jgi:hypothetical protein